MQKYKVGIVGTGGRSCSYGEVYAKTKEIEVVAVADPIESNRQLMLNRTGLSEKKPIEYNDWAELYEKHPDLDGVVITTPNNVHKAPATAFIKRGIAVALEKPMETTMGNCEEILDAVSQYNGRVLIGFVLRSTPFYVNIHDMIESGAIGNVLSMQADELGSYGVSSIIMRHYWRRKNATSGGSMMEKSSHDLDLLSWFAGSRPVAVNSFGGRLLFSPNPLLPEKCGECKSSAKCQYFSESAFSAAAGDAVLDKFYNPDRDTCIYNIDKDVSDNQSVSIQYDNGTIVNFMLGFNCMGPRSGRNFHAVGTRGRIWGNIVANELWIYRNSDEKAERIELPVIASGHNGGNDAHSLELLKMMRDSSYRPAQNAYAGYLSCTLCIAADTSAREGRQIRLRYGKNGYIQLM